MYVDMVVKVQFYSDCNNFKKNKEEVERKIRECSFVDMYDVEDTRKQEIITIFSSN